MELPYFFAFLIPNLQAKGPTVCPKPSKPSTILKLLLSIRILGLTFVTIWLSFIISTYLGVLITP